MTSLTGPVLAEYQDLFSSTTTQGGPNGGLNLGAKAYTGDGREYRFCLAGATTLVVGKLQQSSVETTSWETLNPGAVAIGATQFTTVTTVTITQNILAGGYVMVTETPGQGQMYKIKGNTAATSAAVTIFLEDPITVALVAGTSQVDLVPNPYSGVIVNPTAATGNTLGSAVFAITNGQYGWLQVKGPACILASGAIVVGEEVGKSTTVAGAAEATTGVVADVGIAITGIADTDYGAIDLAIG